MATQSSKILLEICFFLKLIDCYMLKYYLSVTLCIQYICVCIYIHTMKDNILFVSNYTFICIHLFNYFYLFMLNNYNLKFVQLSFAHHALPHGGMWYCMLYIIVCIVCNPPPSMNNWMHALSAEVGPLVSADLTKTHCAICHLLIRLVWVLSFSVSNFGILVKVTVPFCVYLYIQKYQ